MGATAFVEVLFELEGLAQVYVGSYDRLPNEGLPFEEVLKSWNAIAQDHKDKSSKTKNRPTLSKSLAIDFLNTIREQRPDVPSLQKMVAVNIDALDELARSLDALAVALLHSLGDWHVRDALERSMSALPVDLIAYDEPDGKATIDPRQARVDDIEFLPAADLFQWLDALEINFAAKLTGHAVPTEYGQRQRIQKLYKLIRKTLAHLLSSKLSRTELMPGGLFLVPDGTPPVEAGLSIMMPPLRTQEQIEQERRVFSLSTPSYTKLNFSRRVHWSALIGTLQLIREKPHVLWRVISSMLVDANSPARDAVLSRLISKQSVLSEMRGQFRSLGESESLTMSFNELENTNQNSDLARFQIRLEPSLGGSIIFQHESRVYRSTLESIWKNLTSLLTLNQPCQDLALRLRSLGASLGEDVIQDLVGALELARQSVVEEREETPHLTLQLPREFMRFPWELMQDRDGLLSENYALGRQVFMDSRFTRNVTRHQANTIRVLVIGDPITSDFVQPQGRATWVPPPLKGAQVEARTIVESFERLNDEMAGLVEFVITPLIGKPVLRDDLRRHLRDGCFDIIHFAGHAMNDPNDGDGSAWIVSDGYLHAREIRNTLAWSKRPPWLIFANACEAGMDLGTSSSTTDVSGLATACINNGVAAYIAPLWPVDDEIARWLAVSFYRELLRERFSVGESLRRARRSIWDSLNENGSAAVMPARTALTWASFVLYGDPTARLLQTLWNPTPPATNTEQSSRRSARKSSSMTKPRSRFRSATAGQMRTAIEFPSNLLASNAGEPANEGAVTLELAERDGLRFWRCLQRNATTSHRLLSPLGHLLSDNGRDSSAIEKRRTIAARIGQDRGVIDEIAVVQSWKLKPIVGRPTRSLVADTVSEFDRQQVPDEGLLRYVSAKERRYVDSGSSTSRTRRASQMAVDNGEWLSRNASSGQLNRAILLLHDHLSNSDLLLDQCIAEPGAVTNSSEFSDGENLLGWMLRRYRAVLAYDHWALSKTPLENAIGLNEQLPKRWRLPDGSYGPLELDIVCHGRGGLIARALTALVDSNANIHRVIFVGTPNAGTRLAIPTQWGILADLLVNQVSQDASGYLTRLSSCLAYMFAQQIDSDVPGLHCMRPLSYTKDPASSLLNQLKAVPEDLAKRFFVVASNYTPDRQTIGLQSILDEAGEHAFDSIFQTPGDLIVEAASTWAFDQRIDWSAAPTSVPAENILLFNTEHVGPAGVRPELSPGVHHANYFSHPRVRQFIRNTFEAMSASKSK